MLTMLMASLATASVVFFLVGRVPFTLSQIRFHQHHLRMMLLDLERAEVGGQVQSVAWLGRVRANIRVLSEIPPVWFPGTGVTLVAAAAHFTGALKSSMEEPPRPTNEFERAFEDELYAHLGGALKYSSLPVWSLLKFVELLGSASVVAAWARSAAAVVERIPSLPRSSARRAHA